MSITINRAVIMGRMAKAAEIKTFNDSDKAANFSLATETRSKDKSTTEWHNIVAFGKNADTMERFGEKGKEILVEGHIRTRSWMTKSGEKRYTTEIVADRITLGLSAKSDTVKGEAGRAADIEAEDYDFPIN